MFASAESIPHPRLLLRRRPSSGRPVERHRRVIEAEDIIIIGILNIDYFIPTDAEYSISCCYSTVVSRDHCDRSVRIWSSVL